MFNLTIFVTFPEIELEMFLTFFSFYRYKLTKMGYMFFVSFIHADLYGVFIMT